ncbi:putative transcription factor HRT family [Rosa chinensis]|uniref:Putative transcription factor HRT family n=1 Tax=Rosa chinensis TaxID=74649 RepID=A0A2P6RK91_ROSCH|nr:protein EFFECTOR OF TRANSCRIPTION 2 isoform X2 [Rosa chinensis]PRQ46811.1 putative transcription factor HRT family [Rosa chinensis]
MVASDLTVALQRLKREECKRTKHDPHFSKWKVLVGPCDWEDFSVGKEGAERYRVHNLPRNESPGVYELGVAVLRSGLGRGIEADKIVPVYLGQADSVRTRLQQYGRTGAHLGKCCSVGIPSERIRKGPGLFEQILARGYPIVYRWAPMGTKSEALKTESQLLNTFDYAWNTSINGARRPDDVLQKLKKTSSKPTRFTNIVQRLLPFRQKQVGIRINSSKLVSTEDKFSDYADRESRTLTAQVFKFGRSQPRLVLDRSGITQENTIICGVAVGDGSICRKEPVQGRKRCAEHKGMRITGLITVRISNSNFDSKCSVISNREFVSDESGITQENTEICGLAAGDGSICRTPPVQGRKRSAEHRGMRIKGSITVRISDKNVDSKCSVLNNTELDSHDASNVKYEPVQLPPVHVCESSTSICGFILADGSPCRTEPIQGRKRCDEHKGRRIQKCKSKSVKEEKVKICA